MEATLGNRSIFLKSLELNDYFPFIHFEERGENFLVSINYPSENFSLEERALLEQWFDHISCRT